VRRHGYEVQVLTSMIPQAKGVEVEAIDGLEVIRTPSGLLRAPSRLPRRPRSLCTPGINRELRTRCAGADVYHVHNRFWYGLSTYRAANAALPPHAHHPQRPPNGASASRWTDGAGCSIIRSAVRCSACATASTVSAGRRWTTPSPSNVFTRRRSSITGSSTNLYRPGLDASELRQRLGIGAAPVILSNGRLVEQKGFPTLIKALQLVRRTVKDAQLVVVGKGPMKDGLMRLARDLEVKDAVHFVTGIPEAELPLYYNMCDVFALASYYEPAGMVLHEAISCGKAVVATSAGGIPEMVSPDCSITVPPRDHDAMGAELVRVLSDAGLRRSMERSARDRAVRYFDWDIIAAAWDSSYRTLYD